MNKSYILFTILVSALGYCVDVFDIVLFSMVRISSLKDLGVTGSDLTDQGLFLLNMQMIGMVLGGFIWGIFGDKIGRVQVLFASILLYSIANILNGLITTVDQYVILRFLAGVGLAGEVGGAVTLVTELLPKERRSLGIIFLAAVASSGAVIAGLVVHYWHWRTAFIIGGSLGLVLLALRYKITESGVYQNLSSQTGLTKGDLSLLLLNPEKLKRLLLVTMMGVPFYFGYVIMASLSPEILTYFKRPFTVPVSTVITYAAVGVVIGDILYGLISHKLASRKKAFFLAFSSLLIMCATLFLFPFQSASAYTFTWFITGISIGYWTILIASSSELFGTNLRATATTIVPNLVRGSTVLLNLILVTFKGWWGFGPAIAATGILTFSLAFIALYFLEESYNADLDFVETKTGRIASGAYQQKI